jgi:hypothetical protein
MIEETDTIKDTTFAEPSETEVPNVVVAVNEAILSSASFHRGVALGYRNAVNDLLSVVAVVALLATVYLVRRQT